MFILKALGYLFGGLILFGVILFIRSEIELADERKWREKRKKEEEREARSAAVCKALREREAVEERLFLASIAKLPPNEQHRRLVEYRRNHKTYPSLDALNQLREQRFEERYLASAARDAKPIATVHLDVTGLHVEGDPTLFGQTSKAKKAASPSARRRRNNCGCHCPACLDGRHDECEVHGDCAYWDD